MSLTDDDKQWISGQVTAQTKSLKEYVDERTHGAETRLLRAFLDYSRSSDIRMKKLEADVANVDQSSTMRLGEVERQLTELQAKVLVLESRSKSGGSASTA